MKNKKNKEYKHSRRENPSQSRKQTLPIPSTENYLKENKDNPSILIFLK